MPSYKQSGVDFSTVGKFRDSIIRELSFQGNKYRRTGGMGHYAGLVAFQDGFIALHTDGVGTKTILALQYGYFDEIGKDLIGMNVNDIICTGAQPIAMVDYIATSIFDEEMGSSIGKSINEASIIAGIPIVGGETASVPDLINGIDISGTVVGYVKRGKEITGKKISEGDLILGLQSSGFHSNGFSLIRKVYERKMGILNEKFDHRPLWRALLEGTKIYSKKVTEILDEEDFDIHGMFHITGGGLRNILRLKEMKYAFDIHDIPEIFKKVIGDGHIKMSEAFQVFNMGIGFVFIVPERDADRLMQRLSEFNPQIIGKVENGSGLTVKKFGIKYSSYY